MIEEVGFWKGLLREDQPNSSRRLITLVVAGVFIATCLTIVILMALIFTGEARLQLMNIKALELLVQMLTQIAYYEFMIVISGLAFITAPQFARVLVSSIANIITRTKVTEETSDYTTITETEQTKPDGSLEATIIQEPAKEVSKPYTSD